MISSGGLRLVISVHANFESMTDTHSHPPTRDEQLNHPSSLHRRAVPALHLCFSQRNYCQRLRSDSLLCSACTTPEVWPSATTPDDGQLLATAWHSCSKMSAYR
jgi:hypothetical protein